ncbi:MAG TPA: hypothetical protein P5181_03975 [Dermatophilaceae bacterium]|nr:hypothetical protein [Dermatophilaceae bacterium]
MCPGARAASRPAADTIFEPCLDPQVPAAARVLPAGEVGRSWAGLDGRPGAALSREAAMQAAVAVIVQAEAIKAAVDASVLSAWRVLHAAYELVWQERVAPASAREADRLARASVTGAVAEVVAQAGMAERVCRSRLRLAVADPVRTRALVQALAAGRIEVTEASRIMEACTELDADVADSLAERVLADRPDGTRTPEAARRRRLSRLVTAAHAASGRTRQLRDRALARREAVGQIFPDGTGDFTVSGDAARIAAAANRVDEIARTLRAAGCHPGRTLGQLRSDVTLDLLLYGGVPHLGEPAVSRTDPGAGTPGSESERSCQSASASPAQPVTGKSWFEAGMVSPAEVSAWVDWSGLGVLPPARVTVTVPLDVLTGTSHGVGQLHGPTAATTGYLPATAARDLAHAAGSTWRRLLCDPDTGALLELSSRSYAAPPRLAAHVRTRHDTCTGPGCDLDHTQPWPTGSTASTNLTPLHRAHHHLKTLRLWQAHHDPHTHTVTWTTLAGHTHTVTPTDHRDLSCPDLPDLPDWADVAGSRRSCRRQPGAGSLAPADRHGEVEPRDEIEPRDEAEPGNWPGADYSHLDDRRPRPLADPDTHALADPNTHALAGPDACASIQPSAWERATAYDQPPF